MVQQIAAGQSRASADWRWPSSIGSSHGWEGTTLGRETLRSRLTRRICGWISQWLAAYRGIAELRAMDDRMLCDIGLRREEVDGIWRYGMLPEHE